MKWEVAANHAGGYSYRLCRMPEEGIRGVTEECFQQTPLEFEGENQWVIYRKDHHDGTRTKVKALRTTKGTFPHGSMWTANPLFPAQETDPADFDHSQGQVKSSLSMSHLSLSSLY